MSTARPSSKSMPDNANSTSHHVDSKQARRGGQSMNHLLSFTLPPRSRPPLSVPARRSRRGANYTPFNKERYVNAQYRFLVKPTGDYTAYFADPDISLNWADILQVVIPTSSALTGVGSSAAVSDQPREPRTKEPRARSAFRHPQLRV